MADRAKSLSIKLASASSLLFLKFYPVGSYIKNYLTENNELGLYAHLIDNLLRQKEHILSKESEQLLAEASELGQAPSNIFSMINDSDMTFTNIEGENGETIEVTKGRFIHLMESPNREIRKAAFKSLYSSYIKQKNTIAATYHGSIKKDVFFARMRKYPSALEYALFDDNIPVEVYNNLIDTVHEALPLMHRYVALRKRLLG